MTSSSSSARDQGALPPRSEGASPSRSVRTDPVQVSQVRVPLLDRELPACRSRSGPSATGDLSAHGAQDAGRSAGSPCAKPLPGRREDARRARAAGGCSRAKAQRAAREGGDLDGRHYEQGRSQDRQLTAAPSLLLPALLIALLSSSCYLFYFLRTFGHSFAVSACDHSHFAVSEVNCCVSGARMRPNFASLFQIFFSSCN